MSRNRGEPIRVLHVDDDPSVLDLSAAVIEDEYDGLTIRTATSAADGLDVIAEEPVDCVVSDYDMPEMDGLAFLEAVRETHPALPFVLFTGAGSEGLASKAISAGVTDYLRKGTGPWRYEILGNRIESAVEARRAERRSAEWVRAMEGSIDGMAILEPEGQYVHVNEAHAAVYGYDDPAAFVGETWHVCYPDEEVERFEGEIMPTLREAGQWRGEAVGLRADGSTFPQELSLTEIGGGRLMCVVRDVTERKERERELDRNTDLLEQTQRMATVGGWELDLVDGELRWTDEVRRIHGVGLDYEPDVESALEFYHPEDVSTVEDALDRAIEHGERFDVSCRLVTADGDRRWVRAQGEPHREHDETIRLRGTIQDITERKARERAVSDAEKRYRTFVEAAPDATLVADAATGELIEANSAAETLFDRPEESIVGSRLWEFHPPEARARYRELFERDETKNVPAAQLEGVSDAEVVTADGERVPVEINAETVELGDRTLLQGVFRDVTERAERERELQRERDRFSALFDHIPDPAVSVEMDEGEPITQSVNAAFEATFGYGPEAAVGSPLDDLIVPSDRMDEARELDRKAVAGEVVTREVCRRTADGELREFLFRSVPIDQGAEVESFGIYTDITDRREAEEYRRRLYGIVADAELTFDERLQRALALGCEYLDLETGILTHIEGDVQRIVEAHGPHEGIQPGDECALSEAYCRKTIESDEPMTVEHAAEAGWEDDPAYERFGLETYVGVKLMVDGDLYGTVCFADRSPRETGFSELELAFVDLLDRGIASTLERHNYERELERQNERLEEFAGVVGHDLRNPLNVASGSLEMAQETGDESHLARIEGAHRRMETIIEDVLTLARQGRAIGETSPVLPTATAETAWANVETGDAELRTADESVDGHGDGERKEGASGTIDADEGRLEELFENLFRNAIEHADEDVTVTVGRVDGGFYVEDDGPGIESDEREQVFDHGHTTSDEGTGLGLAIVERIAEAHGWSVTVGDGTDGGARFEIRV